MSCLFHILLDWWTYERVFKREPMLSLGIIPCIGILIISISHSYELMSYGEYFLSEPPLKIDMDWWAYKKFTREHPLSNEKLMTSVCYINLECFSCYLGTLTRPKRSSFCWHLWLWTSILNLTLLAGCSSTCIEHSMVSYLKQCGTL